ncbi:hypothetical protein H3C61_00610 [Candidatus Gracilibacteria bacterium]|nr:hypothetical protein [Candidatus Gracilibacteria bacterium]
MKCYYHNDKDSVSQCVNCGKFLCKECSDKFTYDGKIICEDCAGNINNQIFKGTKNIKTNLVLISVLWFLFMLTPITHGSLDGLLLIYMIFLFFYLKKEIPLPNIFVAGGWIFWLIFFVFIISWGIFYLMLFYPIKNIKILFSKENRKTLISIGILLGIGLVFLGSYYLNPENYKTMGEKLYELQNPK